MSSPRAGAEPRATPDPLEELRGESPPVARLRTQLRRLLQREAAGRRLPPILLQGETGTGKGLLARVIHRAGARRDGPFIDLNCASIPETLLEAELFGFERGAFTDARQAKAGLFQSAHRGTIFLDEIALLPLPLQSKLLKVIEERAVRRLGSTRTEPIDVWIITAAGEDLYAKTRQGAFREDLYHRLAILTFTLPPLRERGSDVISLAEHFLAQACVDYGLPPKMLSPDARNLMMAYRWPGNVRELSNAMERAALLTDTSEVTGDQLGLKEESQPPTAQRSLESGDGGERLLRSHLLAVLTEAGWNISRAAAHLRISRNTLRARIKKYGLRPIAPSRDLPGPTPGPGDESAVSRPAPPALSASPAAVTWDLRSVTLLKCELSPAEPEGSEWALGQDLQLAVNKVQSFGGQIRGVSPSFLIALFGLDPVEDAPRRAANAALAIQRGAARRREAGTAAAPKLAIHTETALVARIPGGYDIDTDSRLAMHGVLDAVLGQGGHGTILVTAAAATFLERRFQLIPTTSLLGPDKPVYCLAGPERSGFVPAIGTMTFVGRQRERDLLQGRLALAFKGLGQVVGIVGEPGVGKSRLLFEFSRAMAEQPVRCLTAYCASYGGAFPYLPIIDLLNGLFQIDDADDEVGIQRKVTGRCRTSAAQPGVETTSAILALLGALPRDHRFLAPEPAQRRLRTLEAVRHVLLTETDLRPLVVIVEDLQWADSETQVVLDHLVEDLPGHRLLLLVSYRPEYRHGWGGKSHYAQLFIDPLSREHVETMLEQLLGRHAGLAPLKELLIERTAGNPFFLEETVRTLAETRVITGSWGGFTVSGPVDAVRVPPTVQAVLAARVDRLPLHEKRVLQSAAVIGKDIPYPLLKAITDAPDEALRSTIARLRAGEFLYESGAGGETVDTFKHTLTQEVVYESLTLPQRRALHARIALSLEALHGARLAEHVEQAARHAFLGELWPRALTYFREAGDKAAGRSAYREAALCLQRALEALEHLESTPDTLAQGVDLRFQLRHALWALGELRRGLDYLREARPLAERLGDQRRLARLSAHMGSNYLVLGDNDRALQFGQRTMEIASSLADFGLMVDARQFLGVLYNSLGEYARAIEILEPNVIALVGDRARGAFGDFYAVHSRTWLVWSLAEIGRFADGAVRAGEASRIAGVANHPHNVVAADWAWGYLECARGNPDGAVQRLERALGLCREANVAVWLRPTTALLGGAYALRGEASAAIPLLEQAVRGDDENKVGLAAWETYLGGAYLLVGRLDEAADLAAHAFELARDRREQGFQAHALRLMADIAAARDSAEEAEAHYLRAVTAGRERGMLPLAARCHAGLSALYTRLGRSPEAGEHLQAARALFDRLEMVPGPPA